MKKIIFALLIPIAFMAASAFQEGEKMVTIKDMRSSGFAFREDTSMKDHQLGDLRIDRVITRGEGANAEHDTLDLYDIHFYKNYQGKLKNYLLPWNEPANYDRASYKWLNDTVVSVRLINSVTNKKGSYMHIRQFGKDAFIDSKTDYKE